MIMVAMDLLHSEGLVGNPHVKSPFITDQPNKALPKERSCCWNY